MSAASLLSVYTGVNPATLVVESTGGGPGTSENIKQVLLNTPNAGDADGGALSDVGAFSCASITHAGAAGLFTISGDAASGISVVGPVGASLIATTGGAKVEAAAGKLELNFDGVGGQLNIVPLGTAFTDITSTAAGAKIPNYSGATKQLQIQVGGVDYYIALNPVAFT